MGLGIKTFWRVTSMVPIGEMLGLGTIVLLALAPPKMQVGTQGIGFLRSTGKIGQKIELTATNGFEQARSANQNLWREIA